MFGRESEDRRWGRGRAALLGSVPPSALVLTGDRLGAGRCRGGGPAVHPDPARRRHRAPAVDRGGRDGRGRGAAAAAQPGRPGPAAGMAGRGGGGRLRADPRGHELLDLPGLRPDPARDRGHRRVPRPARGGRRLLAPADRPALGGAGRRGSRAAHPGRGAGRRRPPGRAGGAGVRAARRSRLGRVHHLEPRHRAALPRLVRPDDRDARRRDRHDPAGGHGRAARRCCGPASWRPGWRSGCCRRSSPTRWNWKRCGGCRPGCSASG